MRMPLPLVALVAALLSLTAVAFGSPLAAVTTAGESPLSFVGARLGGGSSLLTRPSRPLEQRRPGKG